MNSFFIQGLQHPFLTPAHLISLIALAVLLGQQAKPTAQTANTSGYSALLAFVALTMSSLVITRFYRPAMNLELALLTIAGSMGIVTALKLVLPSWITLLLAIAVGALIGLDSAPVIIPGLKAVKIYADMAGTWFSVSITLIVINLLSRIINRLWEGIALRVVGSWIFASALMVLALMYAPVMSQ